MKKLLHITVCVLIIILTHTYYLHAQYNHDVNDTETICGVVIINGVVPYACAGEFIHEDSVSSPISFRYIPGAFMVSKSDYQRLNNYNKDDGLRIILKTSENKVRHTVKKDDLKTSDITYSRTIPAEFIQYGNFIINIRDFRRKHGKDYYFDIYTPTGYQTVRTISKVRYKKVKSVLKPYYIMKYRHGKIKQNRLQKTYR